MTGKRIAAIVITGAVVGLFGLGAGARAGAPAGADGGRPAATEGGGTASTMPTADRQMVAALIQQLGSSDFKAREEATAKLTALGQPVRVILEQAIKDGGLSAEQSWRVNDILDKVGQAGLKGKVTPGRLGISVELTGKTIYVLNKAQQGPAFRNAVQERVREEPLYPLGGFPTPPRVELKLAVTNGSDKPLTIALGGEEGAFLLEMKGPDPGPVFYNPPNKILSPEHLKAETLTIKPGESSTIPLWALQYNRRYSNAAYWTEPGEYTLTATYRTHTVASDKSEAAEVELQADPIKITILEPGAAVPASTPATAPHAP